MMSKLYRKQVNILGIGVDSTSASSVLETISHNIEKKTKFFVVTPNPEIILASTKDKKLQEALNSSTIAIPDGVGLKLADPHLTIIPGRKLMMKIIKMASARDWKVFFLGRENGPQLDSAGNPVTQRDREIEIEIVKEINKLRPHFLFVGFGAPKQEKWIVKWLPKLNVVGVMAVGGAIDYLEGRAELPPRWVERLGLEWLWRGANEPWRLGRILNAVIIFPLRFFVSKINFKVRP